MSSAGSATAKQSRGAKTRGTDWWVPPPDAPLNLGIPYVVSIVEDGLSLPQSRVLACITNLKDGATHSKSEERGFICKPGGYTKIARKTGLCRKTVYNAIQALIAKGVLRVWKIAMKGQQRLQTWYFALHYGDILPHWRSDADFPDLSAGRNPDGTWKKTVKLFHTAHKNSIIVRKRSKQFVSLEEGRDEWQIDAKRAPKRGCGRGLVEVEQTYEAPEGVAVMPPAAPVDSDEDIHIVYQELLRQTNDNACLADAIAIIADARSEAKKLGYAELGYGGPFPALTVAELLRAAGEAYTPKRTYVDSLSSTVEYPRPTARWFMGGAIRRQVGARLKLDWEQKQG